MPHSRSSLFTVPARAQPHTLSLHDALPIYALTSCALYVVSSLWPARLSPYYPYSTPASALPALLLGDRKSTRLNSSHSSISYAVFCLKKKKAHTRQLQSGLDHAYRLQHDNT